MTRPYVTFYPQPAQPIRYGIDAKADGVPGTFIGGSIPWSGVPQTLAYLKSLPDPVGLPPDKRWVHISLSLPPGFAPSVDEWLEIWRVCFEAMGWPSRTMLWNSFAHPEKIFDGLPVNHAHCVVWGASVSGQTLPISNLKKRCDDADAAIQHHLGIPFVPASPLALNLPKRRQKTADQAWIASSLHHVFSRDLPTSPDQLADDLGRFMIDMQVSPNGHGCPSFAFTYGDAIEIRGKSLSDDLTPSKLTARFDFNAKVLAARRDLEMRRFLSMLAANPVHLMNVLKEIQNEQAPAALDRNRSLPRRPGDTEAVAGAARELPQDGSNDVRDAREYGGTAATEGPARGAGCGKPGTGQESGREPGDDLRQHDQARGFDQGVGGKADADAGGLFGAPRCARAADAQAVEPARSTLRTGGRGQLLRLARAVARDLRLDMKVMADRRTSSLFLRFADASRLILSRLGVKLITKAAVGSYAHRFAAAMAGRLGWEDLVQRKRWPIPRPEHPGDWLAVDREKTPAIQRSILTFAEILPGHGRDVADDFRVFREGVSDCSDIPEPAPQDRRLRLVLIGRDFWEHDGAQRLERASEIAALVAQDPALVVVWQSPKDEGFRFSVSSIFVQKLQAMKPWTAVAPIDADTASEEPEAPLHDKTAIEAPEVEEEAAPLAPSDPAPEEDIENPDMGF